MGFHDRLKDDVAKILLGNKTFEEDLTYIYSVSAVEVPLKGMIDLDSLNTGAGAEVEFNPSISSLAMIYISTIWLPTAPSLYDTILQADTGIIWNVKQLKKESGMHTLTCTANETRKRGRVR